MDLYSPQMQVITPSYTFTRGLELELNSSPDTCYDWAKLQFVSPMERKVTIAPREQVQIRLGYNGTLEPVFTGYAVNSFTTGANGNEVIFKDAMLLLSDITVNNTFLQVTPQDVIRYCAGLAGITKLRLNPSPYQPVACLPIFEQNGIRAIRALGSHWGISHQFYIQEDTLCWGLPPEQTEIYHFEHGKNIIQLGLSGGYWALHTVSVPFVRHGQKIRVTHPKISGDFTVCRTRVTTKPQGFIRTTLYFEGASSK